MRILSSRDCELSNEQLAVILDLLAKQSGLPLIDAYKTSCVKRRISSRIRRSGCQDAAQYLSRLEADPCEGSQLISSLMIHVSQFFRNPSLFEVLQAQLLPILMDQHTASALRCWSIGCSAGEEPYSLAMLLLESFPAAVEQARVDIFATDIDNATLALAEAAVYKESALREVSTERRGRFFLQQGESFSLCPAVKKLVHFGQMDLLQIKQYPSADLVLCRNTLIYYKRTAQEKILHALADILPQGGILALGKSESMPALLRNSFACLDPIERIYRRS